MSVRCDRATVRELPVKEQSLAIVRACGGDIARWRLRWVAACKRSPAAHCTHDVTAVDQAELTGVL